MNLGLIIYGTLSTLSGGYLYDRELVASLREQGDTVEIISLPWRSYAAHLSDNFQFRLPPGLDLLLQDELNHPSLLAANRATHPCPVVSIVHHLRSSEQRPAWQNIFYRLVERRYLQSVDAFIFNSATTKQVVTALVGENKPALTAYPPSDRFKSGLPASAIRLRAANSPPLRLLFLGNLIPRKGLQTVLEAIAQLPDGTCHLDVIGSPDADPLYTHEMQQLAETRCPPGAAHFYGVLDDETLTEKLREAHVLVVPSSYEGFGIVYLEGMAFGLPAIGTLAGAAGEIITDGENGYLIPPGNAQALAARLGALSTDRASLVRLSLNALERYGQAPTWQETARRIREFLLDLCEERNNH